MRRLAALPLAALLIVAASCGGDDGGSTESAGGDTAATDAPDVTMPDISLPEGDAELGTCSVRVTGDVTTEWTGEGGVMAVGYGPWYTDEQAEMAGVPLDETYFIVNCIGPGTSALNFGASPGSSIPMEPATYTIPAADNVFGTSDEPGPITVLVGLDGTDTNWGLREPGTLEITRFDEDGVAGTFSLPVTDVLAELEGESKGDALVEGEFDFANPIG